MSAAGSESADRSAEAPPRADARRVLARLRGYLAAERAALLVGLLCALCTSVIPVGVGNMIRRFIDSGRLDAASGQTRWDLAQATTVCLGAAGLYTLLFVLRVGQSWFLARVTQRVGVALRQDLYAHLQTMSLGYFHRRRTGALMSVLTSDVQRLQNAAMLLKDGIAQPVMAVVILGRLLFLSPTMTLFTILVVPVMAAAIQRISRRMRAISAEVQRRNGELNALMEETLSAPRVVKAFTAEGREIERFAAENAAVLGATLNGVKRTALLGPTVDWIGAMAIALTLFAGARLGIGSGQFLEFIFLVSQLANAVGSLGGLRGASEEMLGAADRVFAEVLDVAPEVRDAPGARVLEDVEGRIDFEGVCFAYDPSTPVLRDVDLSIAPGQVVALVGPTGAGKSTLADLVPRFYDPTSGRVRVDGIDLRDVTQESLRRRIALVPQRTLLFSGTIRDNIAYGCPDATDAQVEAAARAANAHDFILAQPQGYATRVGERGGTLSGGQAQRVAIARALLADPRILILDEATSSVDTESEQEIQKALSVLCKGRTTIAIAHRLSTLKNADWIYVVDQGRIAESGTHEQLMEQEGIYHRLVKIQTELTRLEV